MSFWTRVREPRMDDYETEEEYMDAMDAYESAEADAIEDAREAYLEEKYGI